MGGNAYLALTPMSAFQNLELEGIMHLARGDWQHF